MGNEFDAGIAREVRRQLDKRALDIGSAQVSSNKGVVTMSGTVRALRSQRDVDVRGEIEMFHKQVMRMVRDVRGVVFEWRVIEPKKEEKQHHEVDTTSPPGAGSHTAGSAQPSTTSHRPGRH